MAKNDGTINTSESMGKAYSPAYRTEEDFKKERSWLYTKRNEAWNSIIPSQPSCMEEIAKIDKRLEENSKALGLWDEEKEEEKRRTRIREMQDITDRPDYNTYSTMKSEIPNGIDISYMTPEESFTYKYWLNLCGAPKANQYYRAIEKELAAREEQAESEKTATLPRTGAIPVESGNAAMRLSRMFNEYAPGMSANDAMRKLKAELEAEIIADYSRKLSNDSFEPGALKLEAATPESMETFSYVPFAYGGKSGVISGGGGTTEGGGAGRYMEKSASKTKEEAIADYWRQKSNGVINPKIDVIALGIGPVTYETARNYIENDPFSAMLARSESIFGPDTRELETDTPEPTEPPPDINRDTEKPEDTGKARIIVPETNTINLPLYNRNYELIKEIRYIDPSFDKDLAKFREVFNREEVYEVYEIIAEAAGVPPELVAAIHYRENTPDCLAGTFNSYLHNGEKLGEETKNHPSGIVFTDFIEAGIDALTRDEYKNDIRRRYGLTKDSTDLIAMISWAEAYNGQTYFQKGRVSPYAFNGTDVCPTGKYTSDGHFDPNARDLQAGIYLLLEALS